MAIPKVLHPILPGDFTQRPVTVNKSFLIKKTDLYSGSLPQTGSGYRLWEAVFTNEKLKLQVNHTYPTNSFDGTYQHLIWKSIDCQFYRFPYDRTSTLEHSNKRFTKKFLNYSASIIALPYLDFGESIKPGSVEITGSGFTLTDDKNGNLYDSSLNTGSYSNNYDLVAYWGFNDEFRKMKEIPIVPTGRYDGPLRFSEMLFEYESSIFTPDTRTFGKNITTFKGVEVNGQESGYASYFDNLDDDHISYMITPNRNEFNFGVLDDFTISFWLYAFDNGEQSHVITKNSLIEQQVYGNLNKINTNDLVVKTFHQSSSFNYIPTDIYPYDFKLSGSQMLFSRSDGINKVQLSGSTYFPGVWHHVGLVKTGSSLILYEDGIVQQTGTDVKYNPFNDYCLMFGNGSTNNYDLQGNLIGFNGRIDEIRFYNKALSTETIQTLSNLNDISLYQSAVVGNVFYKSGNIVISALDPKYNNILKSNWTLRYKGTHTIYEWEVLTRLQKSNFNLSHNPTFLKSPNTDLLRDEATGSLADGALYPYFTEIGYYNDKGDLVAIAKLNQPVQKRDDVVINIISRWHT